MRQGQRGRLPLYCSISCRDKQYRKDDPDYQKRYAASCEQCGKDYMASTRKQRYCSPECRNKSRRTAPFLCRRCFRPFYSKQPATRKTYCSRKCAFEHKTLISHERDLLHRIKRLSGHARQVLPPCIQICEYCGDRFIGDLGQLRYCSELCRQAILRIQAQKSQEKRLPHLIVCKRCGEPTPDHKCYCEFCKRQILKACRKRQKIRRRYRLRSTAMHRIIDVDQFILDAWRCQKCGCQVDQKPPFTKDNFAHLDHIIPLSRGGQHIWSNVQTLCRRCNLEKSDSNPVIGETLSICAAG